MATDERSLITTLHITYALHAVGLAIGAFGAASVVGMFIFGWPSIIAVIVNYVKRGDARGTWLESHFDWQIRTFWFAVLWSIFVFLLGLPLTLVIIGFGIWAVGFFLLGVWAIYRIAKGWMRLNDRKGV
ncbi:MAG TPA: hypothetical protein VJ691_07205 [Vicinamibacterales bacterium]|nr:hypothetical protein [Vicinamibacterales bacterium]